MQWLWSAIDTVEQWIVLLPLYTQILLLLVVLVPLAWLLSGLIDRAVVRVLAKHTARNEREQAALVAFDAAPPDEPAVPASVSAGESASAGQSASAGESASAHESAAGRSATGESASAGEPGTPSESAGRP